MVVEHDASGEGDRVVLSQAEGGGEDAGGGETEFSKFDKTSARDGVVQDGLRREGRLQDVAGGDTPG